MKPLVIDLCCGLGGWTKGFLAEGYDCVGFDIERHVYGKKRYPAQLVLQDITTLHGSQFKHAAVIVASPPCQKYSWMAMPWDLAKREGRWQRWERDSPFGEFQLNTLFDACFRIAREAGVPIVVENVKGAQPWVGRAAWHYGSYYLWGDVPALMPSTVKVKGRSNFHFHEKTGLPSPSWHGAPHEASVQRHEAIKNGGGSWFNVAHNTDSWHGQNPVNGSDALKVPGINWNGYGKPGYKAKGFNVTAAQRYREERAVKDNGTKCPGNDTFKITGEPCGKLTDARYPSSGTKQRGSGDAWFDKALDERRREATAVKCGGGWFGKGNDMSAMRQDNSRSDSRKAASAMIAEIPPDLAQWIARVFKPAMPHPARLREESAPATACQDIA